MTLTTHLQLVLELQKSAATLTLPHMPSCLAQAEICFHYYDIHRHGNNFSSQEHKFDMSMIQMMVIFWHFKPGGTGLLCNPRGI